MKDHYPLIAGLKGADACLQLLCFAFIAAAVSVYQDEAVLWISFLVLCGFQLFSAIFWLFTLQKESHKMSAGVFIRKAFIIVSLALLTVFFVFRKDYGIKLIAAYVVMLIGSVLLVSYFLITLVEIYYYKKLARKG